jgi:hypothetical protein
MSREWESQAAIYVDENHIYQVDLGAQPEVKWKQGSLSLRVHIPYDGQLPYGDNQQLKDVPENEDSLVLGRVTLTRPESPHSPETIQVVMPAGKDLQTYLKGGRRLVVHRSRPLSEPQDTLITVDGKVSDDIDEERLEERLKSVSIEQLDDFANKLRLQIQLAVPNLFEERRQKAAMREQREILLERESNQQIPFPKLEDSSQLARSLTALANNPGGGRIIIGMDKRGLIVGLADQNGTLDKAQIEKALLVAALSCNPPVRFFPPDYFEPSTGKMIASVTVPGGRTGPYQFSGTVYRRVGTAIVSEKASVAAPRSPIPDQPIVDLKEILAAGSKKDVVLLDAKNTAIADLELGPYICGMINARQPNGMIVIRNLSPSTKDSNSVRQQFEARLRQELDRCILRLELPQLELTQRDGEQIGVLRIPGTLAPVALYNDQGYTWTNRDAQGRKLANYFLRQLSIHDVYDLYHEYMHTAQAGAQAQVVYGELAWPIQPSEAIEVGNGGVHMPSNVRYDVQRQAMVWSTTQFKLEQDTNWWCCDLIAPLRDALIQLDDSGKITSTAPVLTGVLLVHLDNFLASGLEITPLANNDNQDSHTTGAANDKDWFKRLPARKSTNIRLEITIYTQELFKFRSRMSRLHFRVPDVHLDRERVADIRQACADLGFQIYEVEESNGFTPWAFLKGIRNKGFYDITLVAFIASSNPQDITRELRYRQRTDSKTIQASLLDINIWLWGSGDTAAKEIASLHIGLYDILSQRLHHLRTE